MGDVLDQLPAKIVKSETSVVPQMVTDPARHTDHAASHQAFETGRDVHPVPEQVSILDHDIAHIDTNSEPHPPVLQLNAVCPIKCLLDLDRALHRIENAAEFGEHAVAGRVCNPPAVSGDQFVGNRPMSGQRRQRGVFVTVHQAAIALDVSREDSREMPLDRRRLHHGQSKIGFSRAQSGTAQKPYGGTP